MLDWRSEIEIVFGSLSNTKPAPDYSSGLGHEKLTQAFLCNASRDLFLTEPRPIVVTTLRNQRSDSLGDRVRLFNAGDRLEKPVGQRRNSRARLRCGKTGVGSEALNLPGIDQGRSGLAASLHRHLVGQFGVKDGTDAIRDERNAH